jgi:hypothetical protein
VDPVANAAEMAVRVEKVAAKAVEVMVEEKKAW